MKTNDSWIAEQSLSYATRFMDALNPPTDRSDYDIVVRLVGAIGDVPDEIAARVLGHFGNVASRDLSEPEERFAVADAALLFIGECTSTH